MLSNLVMFLIWVAAIFLILLILVQRGRGGGLAGAFGGMGGQSAFGTKAGDIFTRVTIVTAAVWMLLCVAAVLQYKSEADFFGGAVGQQAQPATPTMDASQMTPEGTVVPPVGGSGSTAPGETATGATGAVPANTPADTEPAATDTSSGATPSP